jgi:hypothetical protein
VIVSGGIALSGCQKPPTKEQTGMVTGGILGGVLGAANTLWKRRSAERRRQTMATLAGNRTEAGPLSVELPGRIDPVPAKP